MKNYVQEEGFYVWKEVVDGHKETNTPQTNKDGNKLEENDSRDINAILNGLTNQYMSRLCTMNPKKNLGQIRTSTKETTTSREINFNPLEQSSSN
jgi:hypothetical protein